MSSRRRLFLGARFLTFDRSLPQASAVLVEDEKIVAVGEAPELRAHAVGAETVDLGGTVAVPGFVDAHIHGLSQALGAEELSLFGTETLDQAMAALADYAGQVPDGEWVIGAGWDFTKWGLDAQPDRAFLEKAAPHNPVALWSIDYHTLWVNGRALAEAGVGPHTPDPHDGEFVREPGGRLTGIIREGAADLIKAVIPDPSASAAADALKIQQRKWLSEGLTGLHEIEGELSRLAWQELGARGEQNIRVVKYLRPRELDWAQSSGWITGGGDAWFHHGGLKLFADGALGSHTCHMSSPFPRVEGEGAPNYGAEVISEDALTQAMVEVYRAGIVPIVHAIGDQAVHQVLSAYARTDAEHRAAEKRLGRALRRRIEHSQFIQPGDIQRFAALGVIASMQPRHCISDLHLLAQIPLDAALAGYAWTQLEDAGVALAFGSDAPVEPSTPWAAVYAAMTRADISGDRSSTYQPQRRMSAYRAIAAHTSGAAYAAGRESVSGRIAPGMEADFIAVDTDPLAREGADGALPFATAYPDEDALFEQAEAIRDTQVETTIVGGQVRFSR
ncbi:MULTISPECIES: amidohydrolase [unclassified Brevibacterium]|uniref:amidohydrolase n=1 Tax=unclassified Brevibacterium TaxID=2614124 RepID=UPI0008A412C7|nr:MULTISPECIES: amidohydrolase [unclassified Brevibacterium]OFS27495.1 amidohydrolase [Brevibacterium sp. HMSC07C04]